MKCVFRLKKLYTLAGLVLHNIRSDCLLYSMPVDQCGAGPSRRGPAATTGILAYEKDVALISISQRSIYTASTNQGNLARIDLYAHGSDLVTAREILVLSTCSSLP